MLRPATLEEIQSAINYRFCDHWASETCDICKDGGTPTWVVSVHNTPHNQKTVYVLKKFVGPFMYLYDENMVVVYGEIKVGELQSWLKSLVPSVVQEESLDMEIRNRK